MIRIASLTTFLFLFHFFAAQGQLANRKMEFGNLMTAGAGVGSGFGFLGYDLGLRYEHFDRKIFPYISYTANLRRMECGDVGTWKENSWRTKTITYYIAPGARVHLINKKAIVDFSFGINLPLGSMKRRDVYQGYGNNPTHTGDSTTAFFGAVVAELNLNIIHHGGFTFGINSSYGNVYSKPSTKLSKPSDGFFCVFPAIGLSLVNYTFLRKCLIDTVKLFVNFLKQLDLEPFKIQMWMFGSMVSGLAIKKVLIEVLHFKFHCS